MWDFSIQTDHIIEAQRPDLVVVDKKERICKIIDFAVPGDSRIEEKEKDKIEKYQDLGREIQKVCNVKVKIILLVVGSLGAIPKQFGNRLKQIGITALTEQKIVTTTAQNTKFPPNFPARRSPRKCTISVNLGEITQNIWRDSAQK